MKHCWAVLSALALAACLCAAGLAQEGGKDKSYYPLKVGNQWTYKLPAGQEIVVKVAKEEKVDDAMCVKLESLVNGMVVASEHLAAKADGIYRYTGNGMKVDPPVLVLKLPAKAGETWKIDSKLAGQSLQGSFTTGEDTVAVPAGKYKTITVKTSDMKIGDATIASTIWFAPGVGMVKQIADIAGKKVVLELEKFEPGK
jgi:hypothetical protein